MRFHEYLESEHVRTNIALQQVYHPYGQGKINAIQTLINTQKKVMSFLNFFVLLFHYSCIFFSLKAAPPTAEAQVQVFREKMEKIKTEAKSLDLERQSLIQDHLSAEKAKDNVTPLKA
jgi:hypothetical protein